MIRMPPEWTISSPPTSRPCGWPLVTNSLSRVLNSLQSIQATQMCLSETQRRIAQSVAQLRRSDPLAGSPALLAGETKTVPGVSSSFNKENSIGGRDDAHLSAPQEDS
jgi:hypothetical protein